MNNRYQVDLNPKRTIGVTRRSVSGIYAFRGETSIPFESTLERDFLIRTEHFLDVLQVLQQPIRVPFTGANGREHSYTPDFLVTYRPTRQGCRRPLLVEVKPSQHWRRHWRKWRFKWKAAIRYANERGWKFRIHDESRIRDTVLRNIRFLAPYKRMRFRTEDGERIIETLHSAGPTQIHTILDQHWIGSDHGHTAPLLWHLVAVRRLDCDIADPINHYTKIWVPHDE